LQKLPFLYQGVLFQHKQRSRIADRMPPSYTLITGEHKSQKMKKAKTIKQGTKTPGNLRQEKTHESGREFTVTSEDHQWQN
jgi:hypothetical protein